MFLLKIPGNADVQTSLGITALGFLNYFRGFAGFFTSYFQNPFLSVFGEEVSSRG